MWVVVVVVVVVVAVVHVVVAFHKEVLVVVVLLVVDHDNTAECVAIVPLPNNTQYHCLAKRLPRHVQTSAPIR